MTRPTRLRLSRSAGFDLQDHSLSVNGRPAVNVARPSKWGNPFPVGKEGPLGRVAPDNFGAVGFFCDMLEDPEIREIAGYPSDDEIRRELRGKNLACWCAHNEPCHADVLLELANKEQSDG